EDDRGVAGSRMLAQDVDRLRLRPLQVGERRIHPGAPFCLRKASAGAVMEPGPGKAVLAGRQSSEKMHCRREAGGRTYSFPKHANGEENRYRFGNPTPRRTRQVR